MTNNTNKLEILAKISDELYNRLGNCDICPRHCHINRFKGELGFCKAPLNPVVYSYQKHHGEEPPISGTKGSGTIFFSGCNLRCVYCQNYIFSQTISGDSETIEGLANIMLELERDCCHNINLVTPTIYISQIVKSLELATKMGLKIPIVYNSSGYEDPEIIHLLDGLIDIYLPDMRYSKNQFSNIFSGAPNYVDFNKKSIKEMFRQVGKLSIDDKGVATSGIIVRILILPNDASGLEDTLRFLSDEISNEIHISLLSQYFPAYKAPLYEEIDRYISENEYTRSSELLEKYGFANGWIQEYQGNVDKNFAGPYIRKKRDIK